MSVKGTNSLSKKLLLSSLGILLVVVVSLTLIIEYLVFDNNREQLLDNQKSFTELVARRIDQGLQERVNTLQGLANLLHDGQRLLDDDSIQSVLDSRLLLHTYFNNGLIVMNKKGVITVDSPISVGRVGIDLSDRDHFRQVDEANAPVISQPLISRAVKQPVFLIIVPILNQQNETLGYVFGSTRLVDDNLLTNISADTIGSDGMLWVMDLNSDLMVTSSKKELVMGRLSELGMTELLSLLKQGKSQGQSKDSEGQSVLFTTTPLKQTDWLVVHAFPSQNVLAPVMQLLGKISASILVLMALASLAYWFFIQKLFSPLRQSADQIGDMLENRKALQPITINVQDEVGLLLTGFNQLLEKQEIQNEQLKVAKRNAEEASQTKSEFLANMSHEIRTPLNAVIGLSELQLKESLPEHVHQRNEQIHYSGKLLLGIVNDLLDFSKIEVGQMESEQEPFQLDEVVSQLASLFSLPSSQKGLELALHHQFEMPNIFLGDKLRLTQVLAHLIANAIKFTEKGSVTLDISYQGEANEQARLHFSIRDTGMGMTPEQQQKLFSAFSQVDTSITRSYGGTGLGLIISQRLVQLMGGEGIGLESEPGVGSCFDFELILPIVEEAIPSESLHDETHKCLSLEEEKFCGQRVLVVEDHPINQEVVFSQLEQMGLEVTLADNGAQGVEEVRQNNYDLILMDIQMPVMDGYKATLAIREFNRDIPIIALTAAALFEDRQKALAVGMNDHLGKPFSGQQLFNHLKVWLKTQSIPSDSTNDNMVHTTINPVVEAEPINVESAHPDLLALPAKRSILIVDDQPANIKVLANLLKSDYTIQVANNGAKALELSLKENPPDLILLDIVMPDMDGYRVCRVLKDNNRTSYIPVIFITAMDDVSDETKGFDLGAVDYISKPFHPDVVKARVRNHMNLKIKSDLLENMSHLDGLTQIANRRHLDETLQSEVKRHKRSEKPLGVVMLDIDFFKPFNDHYGHGKGDECLIKVVQALQSTLKRPSDILARYGGEEFVVLLPETDSEGTKRVAEQLRLAVEQLRYPHEHSKIADHVTVSLGCFSDRLDHQSPEELLKRADEALYEAKAAGRNRVVCANG